MLGKLDIAGLIRDTEAVTHAAPKYFGLNPLLARLLEQVIEKDAAAEVNMKDLQSIELWEIDAAKNYLLTQEVDINHIESLWNNLAKQRAEAKATKSFC